MAVDSILPPLLLSWFHVAFTVAGHSQLMFSRFDANLLPSDAIFLRNGDPISIQTETLLPAQDEEYGGSCWQIYKQGV